MKPRILYLMFIILILSACKDVRTSTQAPINTITSTSLQTNTPIPSPTTITPTKIPTYTPRPTLSPLDIAKTVLTELSIDQTHEYSPNGYCEWKRIIAIAIGEISDKYNGQFFTYVTVNCANQDKPWVLVEKWAEQGLGYPLPSLLGWSADGKYAYFYNSIIPDGCQPRGGFEQDLRQIDLNTGAIKFFPITWTGGMTLAPDSSKVIYYNRQAGEVGIYDLAGQEEQRISFDLPVGLDDWDAGDFTWSPDGQKAIFIIDYGDACFLSGVSLRLVDAQANKVTTLLERENQTLSIIEWSEPNEVLLSINKEQQVLDLITGKVSTP